jgi:hypothetical protein
MFGRDRGEAKVPARGESRGRLVTLLAIIGALVVFSWMLRVDFLNLPDWLDGGESDPAPRGTVTYKGQEAKSASENFMVDIGDGEATVSVRAKQNWDTPGNIITGPDFQSTNGTSSVADPEDRDEPADLKVHIDYCADGTMTSFAVTDPEEGEPSEGLRFEMGELFVCDTTLEHRISNDAAFKQDDTPNIFHGEFVSFVARAVEWTAAAAACPEQELEQFQSEDFVQHVTTQLAERFDLPESEVEVVVGQPGTTEEETQAELRERLESYANAEDPDDSGTTYEALDIQYLDPNAEAVADSCWKEPGARSFEDINQVDAPDAEAGDEDDATTTTAGD